MNKHFDPIKKRRSDSIFNLSGRFLENMAKRIARISVLWQNEFYPFETLHRSPFVNTCIWLEHFNHGCCTSCLSTRRCWCYYSLKVNVAITRINKNTLNTTHRRRRGCVCVCACLCETGNIVDTTLFTLFVNPKRNQRYK